MTSRRAVRRIAIPCLLVLAGVTGCGLKPAAVQSLRAEQNRSGGTGTDAAGAPLGTSTTPGGSAAGGGPALAGGPGGSGPAGGPGNTGGSNGPSATRTQGTGGGGGTANEPAYERVGISASTIRLGLHAPQTGAAPVPLQAFQTGTKLFWENHTVFGRHVVVDFLDDQYKPSVARQVCEQLSRQDFLVIGGAGTDQIQACATDPVLSKTHTPYLSEGVTTNGLTNLSNYFAITQTYAAQTPEVWANANNVFPTQAQGKWAIVTTKSPNFDDVTAAMAQVLTKHQRAYQIYRTPKDGSQQDAVNVVNQLRGYGATTVFLDLAPTFWLYMLGAAGETYTPAWVGPGVTNGENLVANVACQAQPTIKASFLSPFFGLDREPPDFSSENNPPPDTVPSERDLELDIYAASQVVYYALLSVGSIENLTRDNFLAAMPHFGAAYGKQLTVYPTVSFNGGHFGGTGAWSVKLDCTKQEYVTVGDHYLTP